MTVSEELREQLEADRMAHLLPAVVAWAEHTGYSLEEWDGPTRNAFDDAYCGEWDSEREYAENLAEGLGAVPAEYTWPASHIDWGAATRELFLCDYFSVPAPVSGAYVFRVV